jgi:hypothetical protein
LIRRGVLVGLIEDIPFEVVLEDGVALGRDDLDRDGDEVLLDLAGDVHGGEVQEDQRVLLEQGFVENLSPDLRSRLLLEF